MLRPLKGQFPAEKYPDLIAGLESPDDAAVWKLDDNRALIFTTDFFTPVVDDPYDYGAISAANSLSDVYAMGGEPFLALNIAALPARLDAAVSAEILRGAADMVREAGAVIAGGHTVQDQEPKFGLAVLGMAHPQRIFTKSGALPGDRLLLTKPLGIGVTTTALKRGLATQEDVAEATRWMKTLNKIASRMALDHGVRCATDITGFSLLGHASEIAEASTVGLELNWNQIPFLSGARAYASRHIFPGGASDNRLFYQQRVTFSNGLEDWQRMLLFDPQTSGGLLLCVPQAELDGFREEAKQASLPIWEIGRVVDQPGLRVID